MIDLSGIAEMAVIGMGALVGCLIMAFLAIPAIWFPFLWEWLWVSPALGVGGGIIASQIIK